MTIRDKFWRIKYRGNSTLFSDIDIIFWSYGLSSIIEWLEVVLSQVNDIIMLKSYKLIYLQYYSYHSYI